MLCCCSCLKDKVYRICDGSSMQRSLASGQAVQETLPEVFILMSGLRLMEESE